MPPKAVAPPAAPHAERALVGLVVLDGAPILDLLRPHLTPEQLQDRTLRAAYEAARDVQDRGEPVNLVTVCEEIRRRGSGGFLDLRGGEAWIADLCTEARATPPQPEVLLHLVGLVRRAAIEGEATQLSAKQQAAIARGDFDAAARHARELERLLRGSPRAAQRKPPAAPTEGEDWRSRLQRDGKRGLRKTTANLCLIFAHDPAWTGRLGYNLFRDQVEILAPPPWPDDVAPQQGAEPGTWSDDDDVRAVAWLEREHDVSAGAATVASAVRVAAQRQRCYHPVRDYLEALRWDGQPRLHLLFSYYFGAEDGEYAHAVARWWAVSAVARVYAPGCKADSMVILEGGQGVGKSTGLSVLAVDPGWFLDSPVLIGERDGLEILRGKWIVEFAELASWARADKNRLKGYLTQQRDTYRSAYGRRSADHARQCVFAGSTNEQAYLDDPTGGRRFWPVRCGLVQLEALRAHRDQLWAEALQLYRSGAKWWPVTAAEVRMCKEEQAQRYHGDEWEPLILDWLAEMPPADEAEMVKSGLTCGLILERLLKVPRERWTRAHEMRVGEVLRRLGYERKRSGKGDRPYVYERGAE